MKHPDHKKGGFYWHTFSESSKLALDTSFFLDMMNKSHTAAVKHGVIPTEAVHTLSYGLLCKYVTTGEVCVMEFDDKKRTSTAHQMDGSCCGSKWVKDGD